MPTLPTLIEWNESVNGDLGNLVRIAASHPDDSWTQKLAILGQLMKPGSGDRDIYNIWVAIDKTNPLAFNGMTATAYPSGAYLQTVLIKYLLPIVGGVGLVKGISTIYHNLF